jgi:hypothetical protein
VNLKDYTVSSMDNLARQRNYELWCAKRVDCLTVAFRGGRQGEGTVWFNREWR